LGQKAGEKECSFISGEEGNISKRKGKTIRANYRGVFFHYEPGGGKKTSQGTKKGGRGLRLSTQRSNSFTSLWGQGGNTLTVMRSAEEKNSNALILY